MVVCFRLSNMQLTLCSTKWSHLLHSVPVILNRFEHLYLFIIRYILWYRNGLFSGMLMLLFILMLVQLLVTYFMMIKNDCLIQLPNHTHTQTHTHAHTHTFNGPLSRTTWVSWYQKGKNDQDFTEARDSEWQWRQLGHMQVCTLLQTDNHSSCLLYTSPSPRD